MSKKNVEYIPNKSKRSSLGKKSSKSRSSKLSRTNSKKSFHNKKTSSKKLNDIDQDMVIKSSEVDYYQNNDLSDKDYKQIFESDNVKNRTRRPQPRYRNR